jgi:hypothetical protein
MVCYRHQWPAKTFSIRRKCHGPYPVHFYRPSVGISFQKRTHPVGQQPQKLYCLYTRRKSRETLAYTADFDINEASRTVTHHVFISSDPGQVGTDLTRDYEFSNDDYQTLSLSLTYHNYTKMVLVWKRLQPYAHIDSSTPSSSNTTRTLG